ncbi:hypothetical protein [Amycolatopsis eburnea]|uniref:Uncharacterized protein n=1 Tax=Amycolatopsis eburnea TaxID=2267691 RepID=A0A3R9FJA2_9PSEU|nr:hypothetical protein [Amycolatopsis eburnea]RSD13266.1 hypothetical protein EIY87_26310 [Amycolatopsis eburnea]
MDVREPALPVDPRWPGEPTVLEVGKARAWLARRGVAVWLPTRVLALRLGGRGLGTRGTPVYAIVFAVLWALTGAVFRRHDLPGEAAALSVLYASFQVTRWRRAQSREQLAEGLTGAAVPPPLRVAAGQVGWWYLVSTGLTFLGGAALCAAAFLTGPRFTWKHWYPPEVAIGLNTFALAFGAGATALVLGRVLRAPVIAEDAASHAVDGVLRAEDPYRFAPSAAYAVLAMPIYVVDWAWPGPLGWISLAYLVVVLVLQLLGWLLARRRHRRLPPGCYGR